MEVFFGTLIVAVALMVFIGIYEFLFMANQ